MTKFEARYYNHKDFGIIKHFATEAKMDDWLAKHAKSVFYRGVSGGFVRAA